MARVSTFAADDIDILAQIEDEEENQQDICRICRTSGNKGSPLYSPCVCSGSIKYVHQDCLLRWIAHSNARQCEVCTHPFFIPPPRLSHGKFILGLATRSGRGIQCFLRLVFVVSVWLIFMPFTIFWMCRFAFALIQSLWQAQRILQWLTLRLLFMDCHHGFLLLASIMFTFLGAKFIKKYAQCSFGERRRCY